MADSHHFENEKIAIYPSKFPEYEVTHWWAALGAKTALYNCLILICKKL